MQDTATMNERRDVLTAKTAAISTTSKTVDMISLASHGWRTGPDSWTSGAATSRMRSVPSRTLNRWRVNGPGGAVRCAE